MLRILVTSDHSTRTHPRGRCTEYIDTWRLSFIMIGRHSSSKLGQMYHNVTQVNALQDQVFAYLRDSHTVNGTNFAFVNLNRSGLCGLRSIHAYFSPSRLFNAIAAEPASFGYKGNATCLVSANTIVGGCDDPDHSVFYIRESELHSRTGDSNFTSSWTSFSSNSQADG
jgi:hypothetical protein